MSWIRLMYTPKEDIIKALGVYDRERKMEEKKEKEELGIEEEEEQVDWWGEPLPLI